jgi:vacuolar-type H+-ATPase subunit H
LTSAEAVVLAQVTGLGDWSLALDKGQSNAEGKFQQLAKEGRESSRKVVAKMEDNAGKIASDYSKSKRKDPDKLRVRLESVFSRLPEANREQMVNQYMQRATGEVSE